MITAIYDCRSKQEYIYRTNKIREIAGASKLLASIYDLLINETELKIQNTWKEDTKNGKPFNKEEFEKSDSDGTVIYEGGGNLYMLYKDRETYIKANRKFSRLVLEKSYSISIITACVDTTDNFEEDRRNLYIAKNRSKNLGMLSTPCNVLPFTQTDTTYMPLATVRESDSSKKITTEAALKRAAYRKYCKQHDELGTENLDSLVEEKGKNSILAVIYIDGNDMGNKIKNCTEGKSTYADCVTALREFSLNTDEYFVNRPIKAIEEYLRAKNEAEKVDSHKYRLIIGGGDEITIICRASDAMGIVDAYFKELGRTPELSGGMPNTSCAGIALFHSHAPFADVYQIAESCCEMGKERSHKPGDNNNYIDFHYCHSGITNELDSLRKEQEEPFTLRPYSLQEFEEFIRVGNIIKETGRSNVKGLGTAVVKNDSEYRFEVKRIRSRGHIRFNRLVDEYSENEERLKKMIYDISVVYDLWFGGNNNVCD